MKQFVSRLLLAVIFLTSLSDLASAQESPLRPGDSVRIEISGVPEREMLQINKTYNIDSRGFLNVYPLETPVSAANLTISELARRLEMAYKSNEIYTHPVVFVKIDQGDGSSPTRMVTVGGEVNKPGKVPFTNGMTLYEAITMSGGPGTFGDMKKVRILRLQDGRRVESVHDLRRLTPESDVPLQPDDQVIVPN